MVRTLATRPFRTPAVDAVARWASRATVLMCAALVATTPITPVAVAEPAGSGLVADAPTLGLRDLGANPTLAFYGQQGQQSLTIPVPLGLRPTALLADVELPLNLFAGNISVIQDDQTISRVDLPPAGPPPISLPLDAAEIRDNAITVQLRTNLIPPQGFCTPYDEANPLRLNNVAIAYTGVELPPPTVAEFLPPVLQRLTIFVPAEPTMTESDAAVRMAAAVVGHYGSRPIRVDLVQLNGDEPLGQAAPFERQIVIRESGDPTVRLLGAGGVPSLLISGPADDLANQTRLFTTNDLARLSLSSSAVPGPLAPPPVMAANSMTLRKLGQSGLTSTSLTGPRVGIGIDQTRLGRPAHDVRLHLLGSYTPLPSDLNGQVVVKANGEVVDRWAVEGSGTIDRDVAVPDRLLSRNTEITVTVDAAGATGGQCGAALPITLTIDDDSTVTTEPADPPLPPGFQSIPQSFLPQLQIGITDDAFAETSRAVKIVAGLQRLSSVALDTTVVKLQDALDSPTPAVLIAADGWTDARIPLPVDASKGAVKLAGQTDGGEGTAVTLGPDLRMGSLQTVRTDDRTVLIATSNEAPEQLDSLLDWFNDDPRRWERFNGAAIVSVADHEPVSIPAAPVPYASKAQDQQGDSLVYWLVGAGVVAALALGLGVVFALRRRRQT